MASLTNPIVTPGTPVYAQYLITAAATALSTLTGLDPRIAPTRLTIRSAAGALNEAYWGGQLVAATPANAGGELSAGESHTFHHQNPSEIYVIGTANAANILFITAEYYDLKT